MGAAISSIVSQFLNMAPIALTIHTLLPSTKEKPDSTPPRVPTKEDFKPKKHVYPEDGTGTPYPKRSSFSPPPQPARFDASSLTLHIPDLLAALSRDGGVVVENLIAPSLAARIKADLAPYFAGDQGDKSGFFPATTQRAIGLFGISDACVEYGCNPLFIEIANAMISSSHSYWNGRTLHSVRERPVLSSTVAFRVNPGGKQQYLHRDDQDMHATSADQPAMIGCVTALTKTTRHNGATIFIPGSHTWPAERPPYDEEAIPAELDPGSALIFLGNLYHAGGANMTANEARETIGTFLCKPIYRQVENEYLMVPPEKARGLPSQAQRLLGYGICRPNMGFYRYQDPMKVLFGCEDEDVVQL